MGLDQPILKGVLAKGYKVPTPIQRKVIPILNQGVDVVAMARTGSGKTASFLVPLFQRLKSHSARVGVRALVLSPTRELALQTMKFTMDLGRFTDLRACVIVGGDSMDSQFVDLSRNPDIIVATPGRLLHHLVEVEMNLSLVEYLVFDEADRLFEMGFSQQIGEIMGRVSPNRQTVLMSATMPRVLVDFAKAGLHNPTLLRLDTESKISDDLTLSFLCCRSEEKIGALLYLLSTFIEEGKLTIVFASTRHHVEYLHEILRLAGVETLPIYGNMDQIARKQNLGRFRKGYPSVLIVTDVAARGIDVPLLDNVINFDFPGKPKLFVHRVGRAARAGRIGTAYSLVSPEEMPYVIDLHLFLGKKLSNTDPHCSYGRIPQYILDYQADNAAKIINSSVDLKAMTRVVKNAYKLYFRTRAAASPESIARYKEISDDSIPVHPALEREVDTKEAERFDMVESLKSFRPNQTIMEIRQRNRLTPMHTRVMPGTEGQGDSATEIMRKKNYIHGGLIARAKELKEQKRETNQPSAGVKRPREEEEVAEVPTPMPQKKKKKKNFKDEEFYMEMTKGDEYSERGLSVTDFNKSSQDAVLDLLPDEGEKLHSRSQSMKWDRKKKKYVGSGGKTVSSVFGTETRSKSHKLRNESGQLIDGKAKPNMYKDWQRKSKLSIQRAGEEEDKSLAQGAKSLAELRRERRFRHTSDAQSGNAKDELKNPEQIAKARKVKEEHKKRFQQKKRRTPNNHPAKTRKMENKRTTRSRVKVLIH